MGPICRANAAQSGSGSDGRMADAAASSRIVGIVVRPRCNSGLETVQGPRLPARPPVPRCQTRGCGDVSRSVRHARKRREGCSIATCDARMIRCLLILGLGAVCRRPVPGMETSLPGKCGRIVSNSAKNCGDFQEPAIMRCCRDSAFDPGIRSAAPEGLMSNMSHRAACVSLGDLGADFRDV